MLAKATYRPSALMEGESLHGICLRPDRTDIDPQHLASLGVLAKNVGGEIGIAFNQIRGIADECHIAPVAAD